MGNREITRPSLAALFVGFARIGMMSFGGGLAAWTRREVVQTHGWLNEQQFLSGYALSQLIPGATNVNLAVFIGTQMRGVPGALACFAGLTALPVAIVLTAGMLYMGSHGSSLWFSIALSGMGAVALGMNLGLGVRLALDNLRRVGPALVTLCVAVGIGVLRMPLPYVLAVMMPVSLLIAWWGRKS
jgi:chromate transporter